jgi:hypothetical protein
VCDLENLVNEAAAPYKKMYYINKAYNNYYIFNRGLLDEYLKEENLEVTGAVITFCFKRKL